MYNKFILSLLGNSNLKDDEKGAIVALIVFFPLFQIHYSQERTHLDVFGRFLRVTEVYMQEQSQISLILLFFKYCLGMCNVLKLTALHK